jgi:hypothetical protein
MNGDKTPLDKSYNLDDKAVLNPFRCKIDVTTYFYLLLYMITFIITSLLIV